MRRQNGAGEIARKVRESIESVPPFEGMTFTVDEKGIFASEVGGKTWWRVPITPEPWPRRMTPAYEALAEIEGHLQDERGMDILLFLGDPTMPAPASEQKEPTSARPNT